MLQRFFDSIASKIDSDDGTDIIHHFLDWMPAIAMSTICLMILITVCHSVDYSVDSWSSTRVHVADDQLTATKYIVDGELKKAQIESTSSFYSAALNNTTLSGALSDLDSVRASIDRYYDGDGSFDAVKSSVNRYLSGSTHGILTGVTVPEDPATLEKAFTGLYDNKNSYPSFSLSSDSQ